MRHVKAFVEAGMADYVFLVAQGLKDEEREEVVRYLAEHKVRFLLQEHFPTTEDWFTGQSKDRHYDVQDYERLRAIAGDLFLGVHWGEMDSSGWKPEEHLSPVDLKHPTRAKVKGAFVETVRGPLERFHREYKTPYAHSSAVLYHHLFAEAGVDILCSEIGENIPNIEMMIASNRGAARAYGRPWMIDHSTWWAPRGNAGEQVSPREGHTPWCLFTSLLCAAMGGADYVQLEVDWAAYDKEFNLQPWGRAMKTLYSLTRALGPRGDTMTRFAVLVGHENGWPGVGWRIGDVRGTGLFDGIRHQFMQTRDADLSLKILDVFYPGFERCGWDPEYPGFFAESPLGTVDLVPDNLPAEKYQRYAVLVALGFHRITEGIRDSLRTYVEKGGVLICGDTLFLDEREEIVDPTFAESLIGATFDPAETGLVHLYQPASTLDAIEGLTEAATGQEWQDHWIHPVNLTTGKAVARLNDVPYIVENRIGSGRVFFITALNMVGNSSTRRGPEPFLYSNLTYRFLHSLEDHVGDGIEFSPWTGLEHILNERKDGSAMLLVMNHGDMNYRRDAGMNNVRRFNHGEIVARGSWEGWTSGETRQFSKSGDTLAWSFELPPKSFIIFQFSGSSQRG
ncbi:MAG: hypothetical protein HY706_15510 [Candidatus Hydrogenedentes bacterium]|nr:hypothetical protein [Candidatus Hydrogenedentota bacterium]